MTRLARLTMLAASLGASLAGCGGKTASAVPPAATAGPALQQNAVTLTVTIPAAVGTSSAARATSSTRSPQYVSSATKSITAALTMVTNAGGTNITPSPLPATVTANVPNGTGSSPGSPCVADTGNTGNYICTLTLPGYPGNDTYTIQAWSGSGGTGSVLSGGTPTVAVTQGVVNTPASVTLDAKVNALSVIGPACGSSSGAAVSGTFTATAATTFAVATTDAAEKTIVAPGLPTITANASGISGGAGAALAVSVSGQTVTVTPTNGASGFVTGTVTVTAANPTSDGIPFSVPASFTFSTQSTLAGELADIEQNATGTVSHVKIYSITLGGSGVNDTIQVANTLAPTTSTNVASLDINNPLSLAWNGTGDLLIGNGGSSLGFNTGYLSCVPASAVTSNASTSTSYGQLSVPSSMAYNSADGSVVVANNPAALEYAPAPYSDTTFEVPPSGLSPTYAASVFTPGTGYTISGTRSTAASGFFANAAVVLSNASPVAYAVSLSKGFTTANEGTDAGEEDPSSSCFSYANGAGAHGRSFVDFVRTGGTTSSLSDDTNYGIDTPVGLAYDAYDNQLIVADDTSCHGNVAIYGGTSASQQQILSITNQLVTTEGSDAQATPVMVAAGPDGKIAVAYYAFSGYPQVQIYGAPSTQGGANRNALYGPIPFNGLTNSGGCGTNYIYGNWYADVTSMTWLSATKLLVGVLGIDNSSGTIDAKSGLYIFDTSVLSVPVGCDDSTDGAFTVAAPKQTGFYATSARPRAFAIHP